MPLPVVLGQTADPITRIADVSSSRQVAEIWYYYLAAHRMHNMRSFFGLFLFKSLLVFEKQPDVSSKCHNTQSQWKGKPNIPQHPSSTTFRNVSA